MNKQVLLAKLIKKRWINLKAEAKVKNQPEEVKVKNQPNQQNQPNQLILQFLKKFKIKIKKKNQIKNNNREGKNMIEINKKKKK